MLNRLTRIISETGKVGPAASDGSSVPDSSKSSFPAREFDVEFRIFDRRGSRSLATKIKATAFSKTLQIKVGAMAEWLQLRENNENQKDPRFAPRPGLILNKLVNEKKWIFQHIGSKCRALMVDIYWAERLEPHFSDFLWVKIFFWLTKTYTNLTRVSGATFSMP